MFRFSNVLFDYDNSNLMNFNFLFILIKYFNYPQIKELHKYYIIVKIKKYQIWVVFGNQS